MYISFYAINLGAIIIIIMIMHRKRNQRIQFWPFVFVFFHLDEQDVTFQFHQIANASNVVAKWLCVVCIHINAGPINVNVNRKFFFIRPKDSLENIIKTMRKKNK